MEAALASALHVLAIAIAFAAVVARDRALAGAIDDARRDAALRADNWSGVAAMLLVGSGLWRLLGGLEKPTDWYLRDHGFWLKMGLFGAAWACEMLPMITFIRWRVAIGNGRPIDTRHVPLIRVLNRIELAVLVALVAAAATMAHGVLHPTPSRAGCAVEDALATKCRSCHTRAAPQGGLDLEEPRRALVGVPSAQWPGELRVVPGDPERSLLWRKLTGAQGIHGASMPLGQPLDPDLAAQVEAWIRAGAPACD